MHTTPFTTLWTYWLLVPPIQTHSSLWLFAQLFILEISTHPPPPPQHHPFFQILTSQLPTIHPMRSSLYSLSNLWFQSIKWCNYMTLSCSLFVCLFIYWWLPLQKCKFLKDRGTTWYSSMPSIRPGAGLEYKNIRWINEWMFTIKLLTFTNMIR